MENSRLVYSTDKGKICPKCEKPSSECSCRSNKKSVEKGSGNAPDDGVVRIQREVKGRKGKTVTTVLGLDGKVENLQGIAKTLKKKCGAGGSIKDGVIIIQGDNRDFLLQEIKKMGYNVKIAGG